MEVREPERKIPWDVVRYNIHRRMTFGKGDGFVRREGIPDQQKRNRRCELIQRQEVPSEGERE